MSSYFQPSPSLHPFFSSSFSSTFCHLHLHFGLLNLTLQGYRLLLPIRRSLYHQTRPALSSAHGATSSHQTSASWSCSTSPIPARRLSCWIWPIIFPFHSSIYNLSFHIRASTFVHLQFWLSNHGCPTWQTHILYSSWPVLLIALLSPCPIGWPPL